MNKVEMKNKTHQVLQSQSELEWQEDSCRAAEDLFIGAYCPTQGEAELPNLAWSNHFPTQMQIHP